MTYNNQTSSQQVLNGNWNTLCLVIQLALIRGCSHGSEELKSVRWAEALAGSRPEQEEGFQLSRMKEAVGE